MHVAAAQERNFVEDAFLEPFQRQVNHRRDIERDELRNNQAADDDQTERTARRTISAKAQRERQRAHQRGERGHDDGPETFDARFVNGGAPIVAFIEPMQRKIDNHDAVLLHDTHQEEETDDGIKRKRRTKKPEREQAADDGGKERGKHRDRMNVTLVKNSEDHIHDEKRADDEKRQRIEKLLENKSLALDFAFDGRRQRFGGGLLNKGSHIAQSDAGFRIEAESDAGKLVRVINGLKTDFGLGFREGPNRNQLRVVPSDLT